MGDKLVLGIETSCDDTSVCLLKGEDGLYLKSPEVLALKLFSQNEMLEKWGGVVPEIAARNHLAKLVPLLEKLFEETKVDIKDIDLIGVTTHPGLLGPLLTGLNAAKTLSLIHKVPIYPVNHLFAHLEAINLTEITPFPYIGMLVSGGHSIYFLVKDIDQFEILGSTLDDAAGEAFDKGGKILGLGYPAGRIIDELASEGDQNKFEFPVGLRQSANANLSFSGLKTFLRSMVEKDEELAKELENKSSQQMKDICASYQIAIVKALELKLRYAIKIAKEKYQYDNLPIVVGGGVACNSGLRKFLQEKYSDVRFVKPMFCTDNGAMIANFALRNYADQYRFPDSLYLDAKGRFIKKPGKKGN
jgi:N6-L-threonylcarbamoyladenine synthase